MLLENTLSIIKPNAVANNSIDQIYLCFKQASLTMIAMKLVKLTLTQATEFYQEHTGKPFFSTLINFMVSGPILVQALEGHNAIQKLRDIMGNTNPKLAEPNTLRARFGDSLTENAIHGSDSILSAQREIAFFFSKIEVFSKK